MLAFSYPETIAPWKSLVHLFLVLLFYRAFPCVGQKGVDLGP